MRSRHPSSQEPSQLATHQGVGRASPWRARDRSYLDDPVRPNVRVGELGKDGSIINRDYGTSFRLAYVLTDLHLVADASNFFSIDEFCMNCRGYEQACPPGAITSVKCLVRGEAKWYVDFDKCVPYFNDTTGCSVCIAVCPWSGSGVATSLAAKLTRRRRGMRRVPPPTRF